MLLAARAGAQTPACDQLKATLAARFEASGVRGFSMEAVPANTPVPAGAKVIGTCESGAYKMHYRRWAVRAAAAPASAAVAWTSPPAAAAPEGPSRRSPSAKAERPPQPEPAPSPTPAPAPAPTPTPPASARTPEKPMPAEVAQAAVAPAVDRPVAPLPPSSSVPAPATSSANATQVSDFIAEPWQWRAAVGLSAVLLVLGGLWLWRTRFSAYDRDGLPRGPRL